MSELNIKKKILISFIAISAAFLVLFGTVAFLSKNIDKIMYDEIPIGSDRPSNNIDFTENIFADKDYMQHDRLVCYTEVGTGVTLSIDDGNYATYNDLVIFMYEYIRSIIYGDVVFYNSCYSSRFIAVEGEQNPFTMQKLYDIEFGVTSKDVVTEDGVLSKVWLDYKIFKNNYTLRPDIGSDISRRQHLTIIREGENYKIISVSYVKIESRKELNLTKLLILIVVLIAIISGTVFGLVFLFVKMRKKPCDNESVIGESLAENFENDVGQGTDQKDINN